MGRACLEWPTATVGDVLVKMADLVLGLAALSEYRQLLKPLFCKALVSVHQNALLDILKRSGNQRINRQPIGEASETRISSKMPTSSPATVPSKCPSLSSSVASTTTATARDDEIVKPFDPNNKMTAEIFGALTKALVLRERRLCEQTKRDEEELAR